MPRSLNIHRRLLVLIDGEPAYPAIAVFASRDDRVMVWIAPGYLDPPAGMGGERFGGVAQGPVTRERDHWITQTRSNRIEVVPYRGESVYGVDLTPVFERHERVLQVAGMSRRRELARVRKDASGFLDSSAFDSN